MRTSVPVRTAPFARLSTGFSPVFRPIRAHLCRRATSAQVKNGQCERNEGAIGILREPAIAYFHETPQPIHNSEHVFNPCANLRLVAVLAPRYFVDDALVARVLLVKSQAFGAFPWISAFWLRFVGLAIEDTVWNHSVFSKNRDRLLEHEVVESFFTEVMVLADKQGLLSREHFSVDGTLIQAWRATSRQQASLYRYRSSRPLVLRRN
jgi:hypothetical protein